MQSTMSDESNKLSRFRGKLEPPGFEHDTEGYEADAASEDVGGSKGVWKRTSKRDLTTGKKAVTTGTWTPSLTFDSVTIQAGRVVQLLDSVDETRTRLLQKRLVGEQSRLSSWARDRNITSITQVESMLAGFPHSVQSAILSLCDALKSWVQESHSRLDIYPSSWSSDTRSRVEDLELIIEAYSLLETLRTVNDGFYALASSLSNRKIFLGSETDRNIPEMPQDSSDKSATSKAVTLTPFHHELSTDQEPLRSSALKFSGQNVDPTVPDISEAESLEDGETTSSSTESSSRIQIFLLNCKYAMQVVTAQMVAKETPKYMCTRLLVWGCGLFSTPLNLDHILDQSYLQHSQAATAFRDHLVGTLADIAVILENILNSFSPCADPEVQTALIRLQACFGKYKEFREEAMEDESSLLSYLDERAVEDRIDLPQDTDNRDLEALRESSLEQLDGLIDCLFDILPAIDRLRQVWLLDLERQSRTVVASLAESSKVANSAIEETIKSNTVIPESSITEAFDELDFAGAVPDDIILASGNISNIAPPMLRNTKLEIRNPIAHSSEATSINQVLLSPEDERSLRDLLAIDLQLAVAVRLSLEESRAKAAKEKRDDKSLISQIKSLDQEITRLDGWSAAFDTSLSANPSDAEIKKQWSTFEQLAKIGSGFVNLLLRNKKTSKAAKGAKQRIEIVTRTMSKRAGKNFPLRFDGGDSTYESALNTFTQANSQLYELAASYPAMKRMASDSVKSQISALWDDTPSSRNYSEVTSNTSYTASSAPSPRFLSDYAPHASYKSSESTPPWQAPGS